jgi:hypothetical protein
MLFVMFVCVINFLLFLFFMPPRYIHTYVCTWVRLSTPGHIGREWKIEVLNKPWQRVAVDISSASGTIWQYLAQFCHKFRLAQTARNILISRPPRLSSSSPPKCGSRSCTNWTWSPCTSTSTSGSGPSSPGDWWAASLSWRWVSDRVFISVNDD